MISTMLECVHSLRKLVVVQDEVTTGTVNAIADEGLGFVIVRVTSCCITGVEPDSVLCLCNKPEIVPCLLGIVPVYVTIFHSAYG